MQRGKEEVGEVESIPESLEGVRLYFGWVRTTDLWEGLGWSHESSHRERVGRARVDFKNATL